MTIHPRTRANTAEKAEPTEKAGPKDVVVILSDDRVFRTQVEVAFRVRGWGGEHGVVAGPIEALFLESLDGWETRWRALEVACFVIDLGGDVAPGLGVLDVVRQRDHAVPVVVLARNLGRGLAGTRLGANVLVDGPIDPEDVVGVVAKNVKPAW
jgi:ActR/RegA family two-component response regulator